jgi:hypothetical protein
MSDGVNRGLQAWGSGARLAAPWPMVLVQSVAAALAVRARRPVARVSAVALGLACLVSAASGFFDGGLGAEGLSRRHVVIQVVLVGWTALTGVLALRHAGVLSPGDDAPQPRPRTTRRRKDDRWTTSRATAPDRSAGG